MRTHDLIEQVQDLCEDSRGQVITTEKALRWVNRSLSDISSRSRSIKEVMYTRIVGNQFRYGLSEGFLAVDFVGYIYGNNQDDWYPLVRGTLGETELLASRYNLSRPFQYDVWGRSRLEYLTSVVSAVDNTTTITLEDNVPSSVRPGHTLINATDDSECNVVEVTGSGDIVHDALLHGERNTFEVDDEVRIVSKHSPSHTLIIAPKPFVSDTSTHESLWVYQTRNHISITSDDIDNENDYLEMDTELEAALLHLSCYWTRMGELGADDPVIAVHKNEYENEYLKAIPNVRRRMNLNLNMWKQRAAYTIRDQFQYDDWTRHPGTSYFNRVIVA